MDTLTVFLSAVIYVAIAIPATLWLCPRIFRFTPKDDEQ